MILSRKLKPVAEKIHVNYLVFRKRELETFYGRSTVMCYSLRRLQTFNRLFKTCMKPPKYSFIINLNFLGFVF